MDDAVRLGEEKKCQSIRQLNAMHETNSTNSPNIRINWFISQRAAVDFVLIFDATSRVTRPIAHVSRSWGLENAKGFVNTDDSLRF